MGVMCLLIITVFGTALGILLASDLQVLSDRVSQRLLKAAVKMLPKPLRDRYEEEWEGHLAASSGVIIKITEAQGFIFAARLEQRRREPSFSHFLIKVLKLQWSMCMTEVNIKKYLHAARSNRRKIETENSDQLLLLKAEENEVFWTKLLRINELQKKQLQGILKR